MSHRGALHAFEQVGRADPQQVRIESSQERVRVIALHGGIMQESSRGVRFGHHCAWRRLQWRHS